MSDLVRHLEDRFSHDEAHKIVDLHSDILTLMYNRSAKVHKDPWLFCNVYNGMLMKKKPLIHVYAMYTFLNEYYM